MSDTIIPPELLPFNPAERPSLPDADLNRPIWEVFADLAAQVPDEELDKIPHDGSENLDHYLYGAPKQGTR
jgi:hypothetical protein